MDICRKQKFWSFCSSDSVSAPALQCNDALVCTFVLHCQWRFALKHCAIQSVTVEHSNVMRCAVQSARSAVIAGLLVQIPQSPPTLLEGQKHTSPSSLIALTERVLRWTKFTRNVLPFRKRLARMPQIAQTWKPGSDDFGPFLAICHVFWGFSGDVWLCPKKFWEC